MDRLQSRDGSSKGGGIMGRLPASLARSLAQSSVNLPNPLWGSSSNANSGADRGNRFLHGLSGTVVLYHYFYRPH